jgi:hypothetical protein
MKRTTIFIDEAMERDRQALAQRKSAPASTLVQESLGRYLAEERRQQSAGHPGPTWFSACSP